MVKVALSSDEKESCAEDREERKEARRGSSIPYEDKARSTKERRRSTLSFRSIAKR